MDVPKLITVAEVADLLGMTEGAVRNLVYRRQIPFIRLGERRLRFDQDTILAWVRSQRVEVVG